MSYEADVRVIFAHQRLLAQSRSSVVAYGKRQWLTLGSYRDADIDKFLARVVPALETGQKQASQLTRAYLTSMARLAGRTPVTAPAIDVTALRGVDLAEVYRRPAIALYSALKEGKTLDEAISIGANRLDAMMQMDLQMAQTYTSHSILSADSGVVGYQRILGGGETCLLCALASTQRYYREDLMPIHDRCQCTVGPIYGTRDPGQVANGQRLDEINDLMREADRSGTTLRSVEVTQHGEHGPTLSWKGANLADPATF